VPEEGRLGREMVAAEIVVGAEFAFVDRITDE
jgi:hypothetical protein